MVRTAQAVAHGDHVRMSLAEAVRAKSTLGSVAPRIAVSFDFGAASQTQGVPISEGASAHTPPLRY